DLSDADFCAMTAGKADPMKLWTEKKLKIGGDIMASQKLMVLKKIDPKRGAEGVAEVRASGTTTATAAAPTASQKEAKAPAIIKALAERLAKTPNLAKEVGALVQVTVDDKSWLVDLTGAGAVKEGTDAKAAVTLKLSDDDFEALAKGEALR